MSVLAENIKLFRKQLNLTQAEFARKFGVNRLDVQGYESQRAKPKADFVNKVITFFGITYDQLMKQPLTANDIRKDGSFKTVTEVQLEEAQKQIALLEKLIKDKEEIIELLRKGR